MIFTEEKFKSFVDFNITEVNVQIEEVVSADLH